MKFIIISALIAVALARPEQYTDKYDNVNVEEILGNRRLLLPYIKCVLEEGNCTPDGKELKDHIRDALETECSKCTPTQKDATRKVIAHLINHEADYWKQLCAKYDPQNKYTAKYEQELRTVAKS
ncbi:allergen Tha p 1-like [Aricia agestis]|uniref:allergen Tha p 1-like n=1 Tax=Aricia agestis TaxID=91739 RepID=UPI001C20B014|nr:allergen Tha p 1-like [Aricia agestis]